MNGRKLFSVFLSAFLFCGLSGLATAADLDAEGMMVAGLFTKKDQCFEVYVKEFKGKRLYGTTTAKDCKAAKEAVGLDAVLKMGATCQKCK